MSATRPSHPAAAWRPRGDRGSLPMALLLVLTAVATSTVALSAVLVETAATRLDVDREQALTAARSGIDAAVGHIRAAHAAEDATVGDHRKLPCGEWAGTEAGGNRYRVRVDYLTADPHGRSAQWAAANAVACTADGPAASPRFALIHAWGTPAAGPDAAARQRALWVTYVFQTTDAVIPGGLIREYGTNLCFDGGAAPAAGLPLTLQTCDPGSPRQSFAYRPDLSLTLVSGGATPLCLDAGGSHRTGDQVRLQRCLSPVTWRQQWAFNDWANFQGIDTSGTGVDQFCFNAATPGAVNSLVTLGARAANNCEHDSTTDTPTYNSRKSFTPEATVGAGRAGAKLGQLVNFHQFGRCIDVTEMTIDFGYLILWPCKQKVAGTADWNQRLTLPTPAAGGATATGPITIGAEDYDGTALGTYCLQSPGTPAPGRYVVPVRCDPARATPDRTRWTVSRDTGDPATSYRIREADEDGDAVAEGYCLAPTDTATRADFYRPADFPEIGKLVVAACDDTALQKWNAPPLLTAGPPLKDYGEGAR
ncbi:hypothetical protein GCM10010124_32900 [Pilimelia terevasa]|uniref:Ricin B lectin domain-containing protein n=1 Tax=Pilimelia terevasa TaxID=53372 RepID=A0A8J3BSU9_9ACTN|nr:ricin-type beta-trefoil lectin domain protein [Pilimelia terevasa]GGK37528.1 hypothetical protein GCM10010124_32900 [Pilimelia terevasa]